jgi:hypothetical protein
MPPVPEWLRQAFASDHDVAISALLTRQVTALLLGCVVAAVYRFTHGKPGGQSRALMATLVLLTVLIGMLTSVIGDNMARAFSLVGALSIVRFRTIVEDTRDTAFVIFAVSVGMAVGAGYLLAPLITIPLAAVAAFAFRPVRSDAAEERMDAELTIRLGAAFVADQSLRATIHAHAMNVSLRSFNTVRQGAAFEQCFVVQLSNEERAAVLVTALHGLPGVQEIELRRVESNRNNAF